MSVRRLWLAAVGFLQADGMGGGVLAQGPKQFGDSLCRPDPTQGQCLDVGCDAINPPFTHCQNTVGSIDLFHCVSTGLSCTSNADCPPGDQCQHFAEQAIDGCLCVDQSQPPVKCRLVQGQQPGQVICVDFNCRSTMPGMFCNPTTCNCEPEIPPQDTTTSTITTTTTTTTTTSTTIMVVDHLKCYRILDPQKLRGIVDLDSPQFGLEPGCRIRKAFKFCVPVKKSVNLSATFVNNQPVTLMPIGGQNLVDDYVCYQILCKSTPPPDTRVKDQFGERTLKKFKAFELCTPARKVP